MQQTAATIYLNTQRGVTQNNQFRSYNTFGLKPQQAPVPTAFGPLYVCNDDTLAGGCSLQFTIAQPSVIIVLPVTGVITYNDSEGRSIELQAGAVQCFYVAAGITFSITNPLADELVNYLQLWLRCPVPVATDTAPKNFDLEAAKNNLITIAALPHHPLCLKMAIGKFDGRAEANHALTQPTNAVFVFVLEGAFEVQNRLLEARDALGLRGINLLELEALSNDAIVLLLECSEASFL